MEIKYLKNSSNFDSRSLVVKRYEVRKKTHKAVVLIISKKSSETTYSIDRNKEMLTERSNKQNKLKPKIRVLFILEFKPKIILDVVKKTLIKYHRLLPPTIEDDGRKNNNTNRRNTI